MNLFLDIFILVVIISQLTYILNLEKKIRKFKDEKKSH